MQRANLTRNVLYTGLAYLAVDSLAVEPYALEESHTTWYFPRLPNAFDGMTICHLTDLHIRQRGRRETALAALLEQRSADLVVITGDIACIPAGMDIAADLLSRVRSRFGHFAVWGNHEYSKGSGAYPGAFRRQLERRGITVLVNQHRLLRRQDETIAVLGTDILEGNRSDLSQTLTGVPAGAFKLLLAHYPDTVLEASRHGIDLQLSGHTHGGQVRIPGIGTPHLPSRFPWKLSSGRFDPELLERVTGKRDLITEMYISRGIGTSGLPVRLYCRPEIAWHTLRRAENGETSAEDTGHSTGRTVSARG